MRTNKIVILAGGRGTGKTTYLENHLPTNAAVVEFFKTARYENFDLRCTYDKLKLSQLINRPVILEDATQLIIGGGTLKLRRLAVSCKQMGCDVWIVFHSVNFVPPMLWALFDYLILWRSEPPRMAAKLAPYFEKISQILKRKPPKNKQFQPLGVIESV